MEAIIQNYLINENIHSKNQHKQDINPKAVHLCTFDKCNKTSKDKTTYQEHFTSHKEEKSFTW